MRVKIKIGACSKIRLKPQAKIKSSIKTILLGILFDLLKFENLDCLNFVRAEANIKPLKTFFFILFNLTKFFSK